LVLKNENTSKQNFKAPGIKTTTAEPFTETQRKILTSAQASHYGGVGGYEGEDPCSLDLSMSFM
jgi:hypothetical protein